MTNDEVLDLFRQTNALLDGHFILRSGLHSRQFFQCALLLQHTQIAAQVCGALAEKVRGIDAERVISPALGGIIVGHEIARALVACGRPSPSYARTAGWSRQWRLWWTGAAATCRTSAARSYR
jgi:orotate phosphoribosyltransferase